MDETQRNLEIVEERPAPNLVNIGGEMFAPEHIVNVTKAKDPSRKGWTVIVTGKPGDTTAHYVDVSIEVVRLILYHWTRRTR